MSDYSEMVINEKDPYLREIYALGFNEVLIDEVSNTVTLLDKLNRTFKEIEKNKLFNMCSPITIKKGLNMIDGSIHSWIAESDGSAKRFRDTINSYPLINNKHI